MLLLFFFVCVCRHNSKKEAVDAFAFYMQWRRKDALCLNVAISEENYILLKVISNKTFAADLHEIAVDEEVPRSLVQVCDVWNMSDNQINQASSTISTTSAATLPVSDSWLCSLNVRDVLSILEL